MLISILYTLLLFSLLYFTAFFNLFKDDVITRFSGAEVKNYVAFLRHISRKLAGDKVKVSVRRGEAEKVECELVLAAPTAIKKATWRPSEAGNGPQGWFGADVVDAAVAGGGARVESIAPGSPAAKADLKAQDEIISLNGQEVSDALTLAKQLAGLAPKTEIKVKVRRGGEVLEISATLVPGPTLRPLK